MLGADDNLSQITTSVVPHGFHPIPLAETIGTPCATASIKKPIHNVKEGADPPTPVATGFLVFIAGVILAAPWPAVAAANQGRRRPGGAYRDRTDDLKLAKLALSQLS